MLLRGVALVAALCGACGASLSVRAASSLPPDFVEFPVATGLSSPTDLTVTPDGRLFVAQQDGTIRVVSGDALLPAPFAILTVDDTGERGLLGITLDPNFATNQFVYVYYTSPSPAPHNRLSRLTANGDVAMAGSESVLVDLPNVGAAIWHMGGALNFGPDGKLYVALGDHQVPSNAQLLTVPTGKMLRLNPDGTIPTDNPFYGSTTGINRAIWAVGLRNSFTAAFQPGTGLFYINDVGEDSWEEINEGVAGANYGWPDTEGDFDPVTHPSYTQPVYAYPHGPGCAISGGGFYNPATVQFPAQYVGQYFFTDFCTGNIDVLDPVDASVTSFSTGATFLTNLVVSPAGALYLLSRGEDATGGPATGLGTVLKIEYAASTQPAIVTDPIDRTVALGQTAAFTVSASGTPPLTYQWQRDQVDLPGATTAAYTTDPTVLADDGAEFRCVVSNGFGLATSLAGTLTVLNGEPPVPTITVPSSGTTYQGAQEIFFAGTGSDAEDGALPASAFTWQVDFHHGTHAHPFFPATSGITGGSIVIPTTGHTATDVWYRLHLTVTDSTGIATSTSLDLLPELATLSLQTSPPGLDLTVDGQPVTTPAVVPGVVGMTREVGAGPQVVGGTAYQFLAWTDGGAAVHTVPIEAAGSSLVATFGAVSVLSRAGWTLHFVDSQETVGENGSATNAFDGNVNTFWHTRWSGSSPPPHPHEIQINLGAVRELTGFRYLPRQDVDDNGRIASYEFYVSLNGSSWGTPVASGTFLDNNLQQEVTFASATAQYVRLRTLSAFDSDPWTCVAEINLLHLAGTGNLPPDGTIVSPPNDLTIDVGDFVSFAATGSDPDGNTPLSYLWSFSAGSGLPNSTAQNPGLLQFNNPGTFTATLTVSDALGLPDPSSDQRTITVQIPGGTAIPQAGWSLKSVDSVHNSAFSGAMAFDSDPNTYWHTEFSPNRPPPPHEIQINLGADYSVMGVRYLPRQDGQPNGRIGQYEFYTSTDGTSWGTPVVTGNFPDSANEQEILFAPRNAHYVRLRALSEVNEQAYTVVAEINVLQADAAANNPPVGTITFPSTNVSVVAGGTIDFVGGGDDPDGDLPLRFRWTVQPGSGVADSTLQNPEVVRFDVPGTYVVKLTTADSLGLAESTPAQRTITVLGGSDPIAKSGWAVTSVDSETGGNPAAAAVDGSTSTFWLTSGSPSPLFPPHHLDVDLGAGYDVGGVRYLPRQDGSAVGRVGGFRFFVSPDGVNWGSPSAAGVLANTAAEQEILFAATPGRYVRFQATSEVSGQAFTSMAELGVIESPGQTPSIRLFQPRSGFLQIEPDLYVLASASLNAGQGVRLQLDGGPSVGGDEVVRYAPPYEATFTSLDLAPHTIDVQVVNAGGAPVVGVATHDRAVGVGRGDYLLAVGDSIFFGVGDDVAGDDSSADGRNTGGGFTPILADLLAAATGRPTVVANEGIPGAKTAEGLVRLPSVLQQHPFARGVIVMLGTNDASSPALPSGLGLSPGQAGYAGSYKDYLQRIVNDINSAGKIPVLVKPPVIQPLNGSLDLVVQQFNLVVAELAANPLNNLPVTPPDLHAIFAAIGPGQYSDSLHPNGVGYQTMAGAIYDAIAGNLPAGVILSDLAQVYDGTPRSASGATVPAGLGLSLSYEGSPTPPTNVGSYAVVGTIVDGLYTGSASDSLVITPAAAAVQLDNLAQAYDGSPKSVTVTTNPVGLTVSVTYDGNAAPPTDIGSYAVVATITNSNYTGSAGGTLVIGASGATVLLDDLTPTYNGSPKAATVTTIPSGLAVGVTYDGSPTAPTDVGDYTVVATVTEPGYVGSATDTFSIGAKDLTVTGVTANNKAYDGTTNATLNTGSAALVGAVVGDTVSLVTAGATGSFSDANAANGKTVTVSGLTLAGADAGNYTVTQPTTTANITQATATVMLSDLTHVFDGNPHGATASTTPPGLTVDITYNANPAVPSAVGDYTVVATIAETNYQGSANGTLSISSSAADTAFVVGKALGTLRNNYGQFVGMKITVGGSPLSVTQLGRVMVAGNTGTHAVKLVQVSTGVDVPNGSVSISMTGGTPGQFKYGTLAGAVTLAANTAFYVVSGETNGGDLWYDLNTTVTTTGAASVNSAVYQSGGSWVSLGTPNKSYVPVDFKYTVAPPVPTHTLTINSTDPSSGVTIAVSPSDNNGSADGVTGFSRLYNEGTVVSVTVPATAGGNVFAKWQQDGVDAGTSLAISVTMDAGHTVTAIYAPAATTSFVVGKALGTLRNNYGQFVGMKITVGVDPLSVTQLGRVLVAGNTGTHTVKLVQVSTGVDVPNGSVSISMTGGTPGQFKYGTLAGAVTLAANTAFYVVSGETNGGDLWYDLNTTVTTTGAASVNSAVYQSGGSWVSLGTPNKSYVPVDFKYTIAPPIPTHTLTINSSDPVSGVTIAVSPNDTNGSGSGVTGFSRLYNEGTVVSVTVPATAGGNVFAKWQQDGVDAGTSLAISVTMDAGHTITAVYAAPGADTAFVVGRTLGTLRNNYSGFVGMKITVGPEPLSVTQLGRVMVAGNTGTHTVKLVQVSNGGDVPGGSVSITMTGGTPGQFNYGTLASAVTLAANTAFYVVSAETNGGDLWYDFNTAVTTTSAGVVNSAVYQSGTSWVPVGTTNKSYVPVDFKYTIGSP